MRKSKGENFMAKEPSHVKQLSLNHVCKIWLRSFGVGVFKIFFVYLKSICQHRSANQDAFLNRDKVYCRSYNPILRKQNSTSCVQNQMRLQK
jgi:hypothetical protein